MGKYLNRRFRFRGRDCLVLGPCHSRFPRLDGHRLKHLGNADRPLTTHVLMTLDQQLRLVLFDLIVKSIEPGVYIVEFIMNSPRRVVNDEDVYAWKALQHPRDHGPILNGRAA